MRGKGGAGGGEGARVRSGCEAGQGVRSRAVARERERVERWGGGREVEPGVSG